MSDKLATFVGELQEQIYEDTKKIYGETVFQRWLEPLHLGKIADPDGYGRVAGSCGDTMEVFLRFKEDKVVEAAFQTSGCLASVVCGSYAAELALGKDPDELAGITGESILETVGGLPAEDRHCAFLAAESLQQALGNYLKKQCRPV